MLFTKVVGYTSSADLRSIVATTAIMVHRAVGVSIGTPAGGYASQDASGTTTYKVSKTKPTLTHLHLVWSTMF